MSYHPVKGTKTPPKLTLKKQNILLGGIPINLNLTQIRHHFFGEEKIHLWCDSEPLQVPKRTSISLTPIYLIANVDSHQTISSCRTKENGMVPYNGPAFGHAQLDIDLEQSVHHQPSPKVTVTNIRKPAKTHDQKHCQTLVVKQYWWSNSIGSQTVFTTSHPSAGWNQKNNTTLGKGEKINQQHHPVFVSSSR